jgi:thymidylate kinase
MKEMSDEDLKIVKSFYDTIRDNLSPPDLVIYMRTDQMSAKNRQLLRDVKVTDEWYNFQVQAYDELVERIRVPVITLDAAKQPGELTAELEFGLASIRSAGLRSSSVWKRRMFHA